MLNTKLLLVAENIIRLAQILNKHKVYWPQILCGPSHRSSAESKDVEPCTDQKTTTQTCSKFKVTLETIDLSLSLYSLTTYDLRVS